MILKLGKAYWWLFFTSIFILTLAHNGSLSLWDQDESAYAGFAKTMVETGQWLIPDFMWSDVHRKPPLHFWNIALSYSLFGINEFSVRWPSAVAILLTYAFVFFIGRRIWPAAEATLSAAVLSTTLLIPILAKVSVTDGTLLLFTTLCAFSLIRVIQSSTLKWVILFWASFSLALLTKGPPIVIFTGVMVTLLALFHPDRKKLLTLHPWFFIPLAAAPIIIWGWLCSREDGGAFVQWMLDWYVFKRVGGSVFGQSGPPGAHLVGMALSFLPWLAFFPGAIVRLIRPVFQKDRNVDDFLLSAWFISGWLFYEFSPSKLPAYVVAAHIPLAIATVREINAPSVSIRVQRIALWSQTLLYAFVLVALMLAPHFLPLDRFTAWSITAGFTIVFIAFAFAQRTFDTVHYAKRLLVSHALFQAAVWLLAMPAVDSLKDTPRQLAKSLSGFDSRIPVYIGNTTGRPPSLPFYLGLHFESVQEETDFDKQLAIVRSGSHALLILNEAQAVRMRQEIPIIHYTEIESLLTDRKQNTNYFIVFTGEINR